MIDNVDTSYSPTSPPAVTTENEDRKAKDRGAKRTGQTNERIKFFQVTELIDWPL